MATKLDTALEECLELLSTGEATVEQCLQRYPELKGELQPLLAAAAQLQELSEFKPRPEFRMQTRAMLHGYMRASPRRRPAFSTGFVRLATSLGVVVLALFSTGAALAQSALPGDTLYPVKLTTEQVWRNLQNDPIRADAALANRRVEELAAVQGQTELEEIGLALYAETLEKLHDATRDDPQLTSWLNQVLLVQKDTLEEILVDSKTSLPTQLFELLLQPMNGIAPAMPAGQPSPTPTPEASKDSPGGQPVQLASATPSLLREVLPTVLPAIVQPKDQDKQMEETPKAPGGLPILEDTLDNALDVIKGLFGPRE